MTIRFLKPIQGWRAGQITSDVSAGVCVEWIRRGIAVDAGEFPPGVVVVKPLVAERTRTKGKRR